METEAGWPHRSVSSILLSALSCSTDNQEGPGWGCVTWISQVFCQLSIPPSELPISYLYQMWNKSLKEWFRDCIATWDESGVSTALGAGTLMKCGNSIWSGYINLFCFLISSKATSKKKKKTKTKHVQNYGLHLKRQKTGRRVPPTQITWKKAQQIAN